MVTRFRVGTSGWHYKHWRGDFYPRKLSTGEWLGYYSERFDTVELNNSFYRLPTAGAWDEWCKSAPQGFVFAVKASRFITHIKRLNEPEQALGRAVNGARRLRPHLGPLLYQLPPTFRRTEENEARLRAFLHALPPRYRHAIEFRHESWFVDETFAALKGRRTAFCIFDMPGLECPVKVTAPFAYVRFHGTSERYGGSYPDDMLREWASRLRDLGAGVKDVYVYFNNDIGGHAPRNAETLRELLR